MNAWMKDGGMDRRTDGWAYGQIGGMLGQTDRPTDGFSTGVRAGATVARVVMMQTSGEQSQREEVSWEALLLSQWPPAWYSPLTDANWAYGQGKPEDARKWSHRDSANLQSSVPQKTAVEIIQ